MWCKMQSFLSFPQRAIGFTKAHSCWKWMPLMREPRSVHDTRLFWRGCFRWPHEGPWYPLGSEARPKRWCYWTRTTRSFLSLWRPLANYEYTHGVNGDEWVQTRKRQGRAGRLTIGYWTKGVWWRTVNVRNKDMQKDGLISLGEWKETPELCGEKHLPENTSVRTRSSLDN